MKLKNIHRLPNTETENYTLRRTTTVVALLGTLAAAALGINNKVESGPQTRGEAIVGTITFGPNTHFYSLPAFPSSADAEFETDLAAKILNSKQQAVLQNPIVVQGAEGVAWLGGNLNGKPNQTLYVNVTPDGDPQSYNQYVLTEDEGFGSSTINYQLEHGQFDSQAEQTIGPIGIVKINSIK